MKLQKQPEQKACQRNGARSVVKSEQIKRPRSKVCSPSSLPLPPCGFLFDFEGMLWLGLGFSVDANITLHRQIFKQTNLNITFSQPLFI